MIPEVGQRWLCEVDPWKGYTVIVNKVGMDCLQIGWFSSEDGLPTLWSVGRFLESFGRRGAVRPDKYLLMRRAESVLNYCENIREVRNVLTEMLAEVRRLRSIGPSEAWLRNIRNGGS